MDANRFSSLSAESPIDKQAQLHSDEANTYAALDMAGRSSALQAEHDDGTPPSHSQVSRMRRASYGWNYGRAIYDNEGRGEMD